MVDFFIRPADKNDVKTLADIDQICFKLPWSETSFFEEITVNKMAKYLIAEHAGKIVGYAGIWIIYDEGHITNVAVHPDFRRRGIATALISELIEVSESAGAGAFTLEVRASNESAIFLYKSLGFEECGVRKEYYEDNSENAIIMWKMSVAKPE